MSDTSAMDSNTSTAQAEYLQGILDSSLNGIMAFRSVRDAAGQIVDFEWTLVNGRAEQMVGRSEADLLGKHLLVEMPGNRDEGLFDHYVQVVETGEPLDLEHYYEHEGLRTWFRTIAVRMGDGFVVTFADITRRQRLQDALEAKHHELERFFSLALDLLCIANTDGYFLKVNKTWEDTLGYSAEDLEGRRFLDFVHPDDLPATLNAIAALDAQHDVLNFTNRYLAHDGTYRYIEWRSHPHGKLIYAAARDITERKQLELYQGHLTAIVESSGDAIVGRDLNNVITSWNPGAEALYGYKADEIVGQSILVLTTPDLYHEAEINLERVKRGEYIERYETVRMRKDGGLVDVAMTISPIKNQRGEIIGVSSVSQDITEQKRLREQELALKLEQERAQMLTRFIEEASHEFRTPLAIIQSSLFMLTRSDDAAVRQSKATVVETQVASITHLVEMLVKMSRLEGADGLRLAQVDVNALLDTLATRLRPLAASSQIEVCVQHDETKPEILADGDTLHEALWQLAENALRFTPAGGVITLSARRGGDEVGLTVCDTGPGIPEGLHARIFERFYRQDTAHSTPGFGLGLPLAQAIVRLQGGRITLESAPGEGSTFTAWLPAANP